MTKNPLHRCNGCHAVYSPPEFVLGITRDHMLREKLRALFRPGDIILFKYRDYPRDTLTHHYKQKALAKGNWKDCETCWIDRVVGGAILAASSAPVISAVLRAVATLPLCEVISRLSQITLGKVATSIFDRFFYPILFGAFALPFVAVPYLTKGNDHPHPHLVHRLATLLFGASRSSTLTSLDQTLHVRKSFWDHLRGRHGPEQLRDDDRPVRTHANAADRSEAIRGGSHCLPKKKLSGEAIVPALNAGHVVVLLTPYPDLFSAPLLQPVNRLYVRFRQWTRWHAAAHVYAELEALGALGENAVALGCSPPVEHRLADLTKTVNGNGVDGGEYVVKTREVAEQVAGVTRAVGEGSDATQVPGMLPFWI